MRTFNEVDNYIASDYKLKDNFGRKINYLRFSITEKCNLKCIYCMPNGMSDIDSNEILDWEEIKRLVNIFVELGITKLRLTGGEPFTRKGILDFIDYASKIPKLKGVYITTNGIGIDKYIPQLKKTKLAGINLSIDSLNKERFYKIAQTDSVHKLYATLNALIKYNIPLKINTVLNKFTTKDDILEICNLAKKHNIMIRFIEEMPFNGIKTQIKQHWEYKKFIEIIKSEFQINGVKSAKHSTTKYFIIDNLKGKIGFISGYSRLFCNDCNRIRVTSKGYFKNCLYGNNIFDFKALLRNNLNDNTIKKVIIDTVNKKYRNGFIAQEKSKSQTKDSMSLIGG